MFVSFDDENLYIGARLYYQNGSTIRSTTKKRDGADSGSFEQSHKLNETVTGYNVINNPGFNAGLDIKYSLTSNVTADLTLNTDFAQVEVDDQMINLTRFSLFFLEKRQFFVERAQIGC